MGSTRLPGKVMLPLDKGWAGEAAFRRAIDRYVTSASLRRERRERGRELVDGGGVSRVGDAIRELLGA